MSTRAVPTMPGGPAPYDEDVVLSPAWLDGALAARHPGASVSAVAVTERLQTVATKIRFDVSYHEAPADAPSALCVKAYFHPDMRGRGLTGQAEVRFYQELAPSLGVRVPPLVYGGIDPETGHGLILMEDLVAQGATFLTALSPYTPEQAAGTLAELATLHAARWDDPALEGIDFLASRLALMTEWVDLAQLQRHLEDPRVDGLPASVCQAERVEAALLALAPGAAPGPRCIVHGDAHAGNLYETASGEPGIIDWQILQRGSWAMDVAYHVAAVLETDERERSERSLLEHYLGALAARGVEPPAWDDAWFAYRTHLAYGYYLWAITKMVDRPIINAFTGRLGRAVAHHDSFALLGV